MQFFSLLAIIASISAVVSAMPSKPVKRFAAGRCGIHVTQALSSQVSETDVQVLDNDGNEIGTGNGALFGGDSFDVVSELPEAITVSMPDLESGDLMFSYVDFEFGSTVDGTCDISEDDANYIYDCGFAC